MKLHKIELTGYCAKSPEGQSLYLGTAGSYGNEKINVVLGEGWQGLTVKAVFQPSGVPAVVPNGGGVISVPWEATQSAVAYPNGRIVFEGVTDGRVLISTDIPYAVGSHSDTEGSNSQPPTPSQWEQFVDEVRADADRAEQAAADAEAAVQEVKSDADRASQAAADAEAAVQDVKDAGAQAVTDIGSAKDSALDAIAKAGEEAAGSITADVQAAKDAAAAAAQSAKDAAAELPKVQQAGQTALDDIATERESSLTALEDEAGKQQSAVAGAGTAALEAIGQTEQAAINQIKQTGETQVGAVQSAGATQISQINSAGAAQVQAVKDEGAAQTSALDDAAAAHKTDLDSIASHPPRPNTETGKWQVWNAETGAYQDTDALYQGGYYTPAVSDDGVLTWQGSLPEMPAISGANIKGPKGDKGDPGLGVPTPTTSDAGKVPVVNAEGTGYELGDPQVDAYSKSESDARYAPIAAAIRPTASGNPVNITDSVEWPLLGLKVYGKSTQDGTPSPENPVPIVSAGDGGSIGLTVSNSADQNQQLTISTPTGLPGVRVSKNGNYIDPSGQQFLANYRDWERGVDVQMCCDVVLDGTSGAGFDNIGTWHISPSDQKNLFGGVLIFNKDFQEAFSDRFEIQSVNYDTSKNHTFYVSIDGTSCSMSSLLFETPSIDGFKAYFKANPTRFVVPYVEPIETPIPPEELAAYRALHTYDGTTVVSTAEDVAGLEVKYVADAQKYIDNRLTAAESHIQEIAAAQLNAQTGG